MRPGGKARINPFRGQPALLAPPSRPTPAFGARPVRLCNHQLDVSDAALRRHFDRLGVTLPAARATDVDMGTQQIPQPFKPGEREAAVLADLRVAAVAGRAFSVFHLFEANACVRDRLPVRPDYDAADLSRSELLGELDCVTLKALPFTDRDYL